MLTLECRSGWRAGMMVASNCKLSCAAATVEESEINYHEGLGEVFWGGGGGGNTTML